MILLLSVTAIMGCIVLSIRNRQVQQYFDEIFEMTERACAADDERGLSYAWRVKPFRHLTSVRSELWMTLMFWRPIESFCNDARFLDPHATDGEERQIS